MQVIGVPTNITKLSNNVFASNNASTAAGIRVGLPRNDTTDRVIK